jgi:general secretion pathway protein H
LLVVIVIMGIAVSMATIGVSVLGRDREAEDQTKRLWAVLQQAREEAELQGIDVGVFVAAHGYEFLRFDHRTNVWTPIVDDRLYAPRDLPEGLRLQLWLDGREVVLKPDAVDRQDKDEDKKWPPQIMVLSSGDIMPFDVQVERDAEPAMWRVVGATDNDLRVERRYEELQPWELVAQTKRVEDEEEK